MHEELAGMGAHLDSDIGSDAALLTVTTLSRFTTPAVTLLADIVARPSLTEADFLRVRQLRLHRLKQLRDLPGAVADRAFLRLLYGSHPYGHTPLGNEQSLTGLTAADVRTFHATVIRPSEAILIAAGDCDHESIRALAASAFDGWDGAAIPDGLQAPRHEGPARIHVVPRPGAPQSELRIGHVAVPRATPDYFALVAANMVLGGQFVSRINLNLREDKGLTYGGRTAFDFRRQAGPFALQVSVDTAATGRAVRESIDEIAAIRGPRPVTPDELTMGIAALTRGYARSFETAEQVARAITQIALYDLPDDYFDKFVPHIEQVTVEEVTRVAARHLDPSRLTTLIVGDLDTIGADLAHLNMGATVVLAAEAF
jgi:predicted Zn-dependent peptidase